VAVSAPPPPAVEIDDGVIEEARRRQRRRRRGIAAALAGAAVATALLGWSVGGGNSPPANASFESALGGPVKLSFVHGRPYVNGQPFPISVRPSVQAGGVGLWVIGFGPDGCCGGGGANYPTAATPLWGEDTIATRPRVGPNGEIDFTLVEPEVAAVRVSGIGTFKPHTIPGLPPGVRIVVFYRPPGSPGVIVPPGFPAGALPGGHHHTRAVTLTPLDAQGHVIPSAQTPPQNGLQLPTVYWQASNKTPRRASCALHSSAQGVSLQWGEAATQIAPDKSVNGPAFLSCMNFWYTLPGRTFEVGLLLNAQQPGAPAAPLWGAVPVPGHPGLVQLPPVRFLQPPPPPGLVSTIEKNLRRHYGAARAKTIALRIVAEVRANRRMTLAPGAVAERTRGAWLLVQFGSLAQRLNFLKTLQLTRLDLKNGP
jgi:hypothetical protein